MSHCFTEARRKSNHKECDTAIQRIIFVVLLVFGFSLNSAHAATGLDYLSTQKNPDGSFGNTATSLATPVQTTAEVLRAYQMLGQQTQPAYAPTLGYLNSDTEANTEFLARKILVNAKAGYDVTALINALIANQNADGGFGNQADDASSVLDTAYALEALAAANYSSGTLVSNTAGYLLSKQTATGGWGNGVNDPSVFVTAQAMRALWFYRNTYVGVSTALTSAQNFLLAQRGPDGAWSEPFETALALLAIVPNVSDLALVDASATALSSAQSANGSWSDDPYTTALAMQAISAYQARKGGATPTLTGVISGYVVRAGSTEPIAGAQITLAERPGTSVLTNSAGYFLISSLPPGTYTVTASKTGYNAASLVTSAQGGQVTLAGTLALDLATQSGIVAGKVYDAQDLTALPGASVTLTGGAVHSTVTGADGTFNLGTLAPGNYSVAIALNGYVMVNGTATVVGGQTLTINQGLIKSGGFQDAEPGTISGTVIDAGTGLPIAGAVFDLGNGFSDVSSATGQFTIPNVPRGNYTATLSATGYVSQAYIVSFPAGATGNLGVLVLYAASSNTAPTSLTLNGLVVDGVTRAPIAGATVTLVETGATATSGADGRFTFSGITLKNFTLATTASGYEPGTLAVSVSAFGQAEITVALAPPGTGATTSTLQGTVRDAQSGAPIAGARVSIDSTSLSAVADANGQYVLSGIDSLHFSVTASAVGFQQASSPVDLAAAGTYTLNPLLQPVTVAGFQVLAVTANESQWGADDTGLFTAQVASLLTTPKSALVIGEVVDASGATVATLIPYAEGTTVPMSEFSFAPNETKTLTIPWPTAQLAPGTYTVIVRVVEPGTISRDTPRGQILAENNAYGTLIATTGISGALAIDPPLTQAGATSPVALAALVRNNGNVPLVAGAYELTVTDATGATVLYSVQATGGAIEVGANVSVDFGTWVPTASGNLNVRVQAAGGAVPGTITGQFYVGDKASGTFTVDKTVVPEGTQTVRGRIAMQGVDVRQGGSTDPLFALVQQAVKRGGAYTAPNAKNWHTTNRCLGCHIQTQSLFGLASSMDKAEIDVATTKFLFNAISTSQHNNGSTYVSHPEFAKAQTYLGAWALGSWPDKQESFRTVYKAAKFVYDTRISSGNFTFWRTDHSSGWWNTDVANTALALSGMSEAMRIARAADVSHITDYILGTGINMGPGTRAHDIEVGPDGALYVAKRDGRNITRIDPVTDQATNFVPTLPSGRAFGIAFDANGLMYISGDGIVMRRNADGTLQTVYTGSGMQADVEIGPDGMLYVSEFNANRITRFSPVTGQSEVFASGGLLRNPFGLAFDAAGNLLVANYNGFNVLKIAPDRSVSMLADGLAFRPVWLTPVAGGDVYVSTDDLQGLVRVRPNGTAERVISSDMLRGLAVWKAKLYVGNETLNSLHEVRPVSLDTSLLASFETEVARGARFFLTNYQDNTGDNVVHAIRMIGLAYARESVTDQALLGQINTAIAYEDNLLRARQRADGGWGRFQGQGSDPLVTAMAGIAIDYTDPSPDDPQVRKTIQYLLNTQAGDGSWGNVNNGLTTRLASTSFVMAYLPKALERLGGIDVDLHLEVPANVQLTNPSIAPTSTAPVTGGGTAYLWKLLGVTNAGRSVDFDITLSNMQLNESRPVATQAYLEFNNSFTTEKLQVPLAVPAVRAASGMSLGVATDKQSYQADEPVAITASVINTGPTVGSGQVQLAIRAPGGAVNLVEFAPLPVENLAVGATLPLPVTWNTGTTLAGAYEVYGRLFDTQGRLVAEATAPFSILAPGAAAAATSVTTDKPSYAAWDVVLINGRVWNVAPNALLAPTRVELTVRSPSGTVLFFETRSLAQLTPLALRDLAYTMILADAASGTYPVELVLKDAFTRTVLGTSVTSFQVQRRDIQGLTGSVIVESPTVYQGEPDRCTETAKNVSGTALTGVRLIHRLINADTGIVVNEVAETVDLAAGGIVHNYFRNIDTRTLALGGYVCAIDAELNGQVKTLAFGGFQVILPPIRIDASLTLGAKGRLLVLLDHALAGSNNPNAYADPYGPDAAPRLDVQRTFLEALLRKAGWSYTITETADDFTRELRTGGYSVYALFSEGEKLAEQVQKELREAVFRGEGLLEAGSHDQRQGRIDEALGIKYIGQYMNATMLEMTLSPLHAGGQEAFIFDDKELRAERQGAQSAGRYLGESGDGRDAVTYHEYGAGKSVYAGFDLLAQATAAGEQSLFTALLLNSLNYVHPANLTAISGAVIPVDIVLTNQGVAAQVKVQLALPAGTTLIDAGTAQVADGVMTWETALAVGESKTLTFWLRLPAPGQLTLTATVSAGVNSQSLRLVAEPNMTLPVNDPESLTSVMNRIDTLLSNQNPNSQSLKQARKFVEKALGHLHPALAIDDLLKAADSLVGITDADVVAIRVAIGQWIRWASPYAY
ncbi:MAG: carboxypeptidase regulatory-like domain-containing protein [Sulfuricaulis sp.]